MKKLLAGFTIAAILAIAPSAMAGQEKPPDPPPKINSSPSEYCAAEHSSSYDCIDPDYPFEAYL